MEKLSLGHYLRELSHMNSPINLTNLECFQPEVTLLRTSENSQEIIKMNVWKLTSQGKVKISELREGPL